MHATPPVPPRKTRPTESPSATNPGAPFHPGQWPTPELVLHPIGRYSICSTKPFTSTTIQNALDSLGTSSTLYLLPSSVWDIISPIQLHEHQELATWGYPTDEKQMAHLEAGKDCYPHIINARAKSGAKLRNVLVDGGRDRHGHEPKCGVMLQFGNRATDQVIDRCIIRHPRHWSCIQAFEGSQNVRITNNRIGPAGIGADIDQGKWADGISFAGANGLVAGNEILDATDGAIVVFGAPGTLITSNTIIARSRLALGAINMVDWAPHDGNYTQTRVIHNTIITQGTAGYIKVGIGQGPSVWWSSNPSDSKINSGAIVANNLIDSQDIGLGLGSVGYGFAVASDVKDWICVGNATSSKVRYEGDITKSLPVPNVAPGPFVHDVPQAMVKFADSGLISPSEMDVQRKYVTLQPEFSHGRGRIKFLIAISPGSSRVLSYQPGQLQLAKGQMITLKGAVLTYELDGMVRVRERQGSRTGAVLWEGGPRNQMTSSSYYLTYSEGGKLCISTGDTSQVYFDFMPHLPIHPPTGSDMSMAPTLVFSDTLPHLSTTTPASSNLFSSSYTFPHSRAFPGGQVIARTYLYENSQRTVLYTLSPYCQFVVLRSKNTQTSVPNLPLVWPLPEHESQWEWEIVWTTPNPRTKEKRTDAMMYFQGDGNLVIRSQNTVPWASGSSGKTPPATHMRLGIGSVEEPWVEIIDKNGSRVWGK